MKLRVLDLFSGIGGFSLGLERTGGFETVAFCEQNEFCQRVLAKHWPHVPLLDDVTTAEFTEGMADVVVGGFPCQDVSLAGRRAGLAGERSGLYRELVRALRVVRPRHAIVENVAALLSSRGEETRPAERCLCGWPIGWRRVFDCGAVHEQAQHISTYRRRDVDKGNRTVDYVEGPIWRVPSFGSGEDSTLGSSNQVEFAGAKLCKPTSSSRSTSGSKEGTSVTPYFVVGNRIDDADDPEQVGTNLDVGSVGASSADQSENSSFERQGAECSACPSCGRRLAHEIRNPLTPIQLSAERLNRKYLKQITEDPETFTACTDTIVRHVNDLNKMLEEFSAFARMPTPTMKDENLNSVCRDSIMLQRHASPEIQFDMKLPDHAVRLRFDTRQVRQALTNLIKNAVEAIEAREGENLDQGKVSLELNEDNDAVRITVTDNGKGLPSEGRERLTEPYVTTRPKGTGLGLAIVKKIMEDHKGELLLEDSSTGGAKVTLVFFPQQSVVMDTEIHHTAA
jgi:nitrogen-specific signal transduction histidine kinase